MAIVIITILHQMQFCISSYTYFYYHYVLITFGVGTYLFHMHCIASVGELFYCRLKQ